MDFQGRYQILEMLVDGEARTFKARQTSSGRTVLLHQLWAERTPPHQPDLATLVFGFLRRATADEMKVLIDMGEEAGRVFVVTEDLPMFHDLRRWLQSPSRTPEAPEAAGKASVPKPAPSADAKAGEASGGLLSQARQESPASLDATQPLTSPRTFKPTVPPPPPTKAKEEAGEFTRVFFGKDLPLPAAVGPASPAPEKPGATPVVPPPPMKPKEQAGEFTRVFFAQDMRMPEAVGPVSPPSEEVSAPPASLAEKPREIAPAASSEAAFATRQEQPGGPQQPTIEQPSQPSAPAPSPGQGASGDFTRIFFGVDESKAMPSGPTATAPTTRVTPVGPDRPSQPEGPGEFTRLFRPQELKERLPGEAPIGGEARPSFPPVQPTEQQGPGEFTLLFHPSPEAPRTAGSAILPTSPRPTAPLPSPSTQQSPGELTQLLQGYQPGKSAPAPPVLERPEPVAAPPPSKVDEAQPGTFTMLFRQPPEVTPPPAMAPPPQALQTPPASPQPAEPDEYMRMFELPSGGAGASPQSTPQGSSPAAPQPAARGAMPAIPTAPVSPPMAPGMPYVQPPAVPTPMVPQPQPYQISPPQLQQPPTPPAFAAPPQPVLPQVQPVAVPVPARPHAVPPKTGKGKVLVPLLILGGLFVIAVVVIVIFALKH